MGVATVTFPQGLEFFNFFLRYYRPIRGNWWRKTFVINFFQVEPYFSLTICILSCKEKCSFSANLQLKHVQYGNNSRALLIETAHLRAAHIHCTVAVS